MIEAVVTITVEGSNDPPMAFRRIIPIDGSAHQPGGLTFMWTHSLDPDGDAVNYTLSLNSSGQVDTSFTMQDTSLTVDMRTFNLPTGSFSVSWTVKASDGQSETDPTNGMGTFTLDVITSVESPDPGVLTPTEFKLYSNYPNPFNPTTQLKYELPERAQVRLDIYNMLGQKIRTLVDGEQTAGVKTMQWDARDDTGRQMTTGVYFLKLEANPENGQPILITRKMTLLK